MSERSLLNVEEVNQETASAYQHLLERLQLVFPTRLMPSTRGQVLSRRKSFGHL